MFLTNNILIGRSYISQLWLVKGNKSPGANAYNQQKVKRASEL